MLDSACYIQLLLCMANVHLYFDFPKDVLCIEKVEVSIVQIVQYLCWHTSIHISSCIITTQSAYLP